MGEEKTREREVRRFIEVQEKLREKTEKAIEFIKEEIKKKGLRERLEEVVKGEKGGREEFFDELANSFMNWGILLTPCAYTDEKRREELLSSLRGGEAIFREILEQEKISKLDYSRILGNKLFMYLLHDSRKIPGIPITFHLREGLARKFVNNPESFFRFAIYLREEAIFLASSLNGINVEYSELNSQDLEKIIETSLLIVGGRKNLRVEGIEGRGEEKCFGEIISYVDNLKIRGNRGALFSIIYNLVKNSAKKLVDVEKRRRGEVGSVVGSFGRGEESRIIVGIENHSKNYAIVETDNGKPICLDSLLNDFKIKINKEKIENYLRRTNPKVLEIMNEWSKGEISSLYKLEWRDFVSLMFIGGLSGIGQKFVSGSGLGLESIRYFVENFGARLYYSQSYKTGGPVFGILLPKNPEEGWGGGSGRVIGYGEDVKKVFSRIEKVA